MTSRVLRTLFVATTILGFAAALSACGSGSDDTAAPDATTQTAPTAPTAPTTPTTRTAEPTQSASTGKPADATNGDGCPVDASTLIKIVNNNPDFATTAALSNLDCYKGWATAGQEVSKDYITKHGQVQPVTFVFRYDRSATRWTYAAAGTSDICPASMPADIKAHFRVCGY